jgi:hypothetical protein
MNLVLKPLNTVLKNKLKKLQGICSEWT